MSKTKKAAKLAQVRQLVGQARLDQALEALGVYVAHQLREDKDREHYTDEWTRLTARHKALGSVAAEERLRERQLISGAVLEMVRELGQLPEERGWRLPVSWLVLAGIGLLVLVALLWWAKGPGGPADATTLEARQEQQAAAGRMYLIAKQSESMNNLALLDTLARVFDRTERNDEIYISGSGSVVDERRDSNEVIRRYKQSYAAALARGVVVHRIQYVKAGALNAAWIRTLSGLLARNDSSFFKLTLVRDRGLNFRQLCIVNPKRPDAFVELALSVKEVNGVSLAGSALVTVGDSGLAQELLQTFDQIVHSPDAVVVRDTLALHQVLQDWARGE